MMTIQIYNLINQVKLNYLIRKMKKKIKTQLKTKKKNIHNQIIILINTMNL